MPPSSILGYQLNTNSEAAPLHELSAQLLSPLNVSEISNSSAAFLQEESPSTSYLQGTKSAQCLANLHTYLQH